MEEKKEEKSKEEVTLKLKKRSPTNKSLNKRETPFSKLWQQYKKKQDEKSILKKNSSNLSGLSKSNINPSKLRDKSAKSSCLSNLLFNNYSYLFKIASINGKLRREDLLELPLGGRICSIKEKINKIIQKLNSKGKILENSTQIIYAIIKQNMIKAILLKILEQILTLTLTLQLLTFLPEIKAKILNPDNNTKIYYGYFHETSYFFFITPLSSGILAFLRYLVKENSAKFVNRSVSTTNQVLRYLLFQKMIQANLTFLRNADNSLVTRLSIFKFEAIVEFVEKIPDLFAFPIFLVLSFCIIFIYISITAVISFVIFFLTSIILILLIKKLSKKNLKYEYCGSLRSSTVHELIDKLLTVKLDSMEDVINEKISTLRKSEVGLLQKMYGLRAVANFVMSLSPILSSLVIILLENMVREEKLNVTQTISILSVIGNLQKPLSNFVILLDRYFAFKFGVSCLNNFMFGIGDKPENLKIITEGEKGRIVVKNCTTEVDDDEELVEELKFIFGFDLEKKPKREKEDEEEKLALEQEILNSAKLPLNSKNSNRGEIKLDGSKTRGIEMATGRRTVIIPKITKSGSIRKRIVNISLDFEIKPKEKVMIFSSFDNNRDAEFLLNILGETEIREGSFEIYGKTTFIDLTYLHFLKGESIKENIIMGSKFSKENYEKIVEKCELDFDKFPGGDMMQVLKEGLNMDEEDAMKILLARGLYADTDIYLINIGFGVYNNDDFFGESTFYNKIVQKILKDKTVVITGKSEVLMEKVDRCFFMEEGMLKELDADEESKEVIMHALLNKEASVLNSSRNSKDNNNHISSKREHKKIKSIFSPRFKPKKMDELGIPGSKLKAKKSNLNVSIADELEKRQDERSTPAFGKYFDKKNRIVRSFNSNIDLSELEKSDNSSFLRNKKKGKTAYFSPSNKNLRSISKFEQFNIIQPKPVFPVDGSFESNNNDNRQKTLLKNRVLMNKRTNMIQRSESIRSPANKKHSRKNSRKSTKKHRKNDNLTHITDGNQLIGHLFKGFLSVKDRKEKGKVVNNWHEDEVYTDLIQTLTRYIFIKKKPRIICQLILLFLTTFLLLFLDFWVSAWSTNLFTSISSTEYILGYILISLVSLLAILLRDRSFYKTFMGNSNKIHNKMMDTLLNIDQGWLSLRPSTQIRYKLSYDMRKIDNTLNVQLQVAFEGFLMVTVGMLVVNYVYLGILLLFGIIFYFFFKGIIRKYVKVTQSLIEFIAENNAKMQTVFNETLEESLSFRVIGKSEILEKRFVAISNQLQRTVTHLNFYSKRWLGIRLGFLYSILTMLVYLIPAFYLYFFNSIYSRNLLEFALAVSWSLKLLGSLENSIFMFLEAYIQTASFGRIEYFIFKSKRDDASVVKINQKNAYEMPIISKNVNVTVNEFKVLNNISFDLKVKSKLALIGEAYYDKLNLVKLILGVYDRDCDKISPESVFKIFGSDINDISKKELRENIAYLDKDPTLISGTVRSNIDPKSNFKENELIWIMNNFNIISILTNDKKKQLLRERRYQSRMLFGNQESGDNEALNLIEDIYSEIADDFLSDPYIRKAIKMTKFHNYKEIGLIYDEEMDISVKKTENVQEEKVIGMKFKGRRKGVMFSGMGENFLFNANKDKEEKTKIMIKKKLSEKNFRIAETEILRNFLKLKITSNDSLLYLKFKRVIKVLRMLISKAKLLIIDQDALEFGDGNLDENIKKILELKKDSTIIILLHDFDQLGLFDDFIMMNEDGEIAFKGKVFEDLAYYRSDLSQFLIEKDRKLYQKLRGKLGIDQADSSKIGLWDEENCDYKTEDFEEIMNVTERNKRQMVDDTMRNANVGVRLWPEDYSERNRLLSFSRKKMSLFSFRDIGPKCDGFLE